MPKASCRSLDDRPPSRYRKDGAELKTNQFAATCHICSDRLQPGEAMVGGRTDGGFVRWICGAGRWDRP